MDQVHVIRHKVLIEKQSVRRVARELGLSRNTVSKYLGESAPVRRQTQPRPTPVRDQVTQRIEELIAEWRGRTTAKQRITGTRLHRQLVEEDHKVGLTTVYECLREQRRQAAEVYIPLVYKAGDVAQVDFFEVTVDVEGSRQPAWKFVMRLMYSGYDFAWLYERCDQLSFLDAHVRAFAHFGGVPARCVYDNLTAAVHRRIGLHGVERKLTERFAALVSHYLFEPCFARPGEGHDKGGVEARGRGIRLQHMTPIPEGKSLAEIATELQAQIIRHAAMRMNVAGESVAARLAFERSALGMLPAVPFEARLMRTVPVSSRATVQIDGALYSVPSRWARLEVMAFIGVEDIRLVCRGETQEHVRQPTGGRSVRYRHYLSELSHKPQAVRQVAPQLTHELGEPYGQLWELLVKAHGAGEAARVLARLLGAIGAHGEEAVARALSQALAASRDSRPAPHATQALAEPVLEVEVPAALRSYQIEAGRATDYDWLLTGGLQ